MNKHSIFRKPGWKIALILATIIMSVWMITPLGEKIKLGLDLKGGLHLVLSVETDEAFRIRSDRAVQDIKSLLIDSRTGFESVKRTGNDEIKIKGIDRDAVKPVHDLMEKHFSDWTVDISAGHLTLSLPPKIKRSMRNRCIRQSIETIRTRVDTLGVKDAGVQRLGIQGEDKILVSLPGVDDLERVKKILTSMAMLEFKHIAAGPFPSETAVKQHYGGSLPDGLIIVPTNPQRGEVAYYILNAAPVVTGEDLKRASRGRDGFGSWEVHFELNSKGAEKFRTYTAANIGKYMAVVFDKKIESAARIDNVLSFNTRIIGNFSYEEVNDMVLKLQSGSLAAPMKTIEERVIGASLGADSIKKGITASIAGLVLVMLFMVTYYRAAGINSVIALLLNILLLMAAMAYLGFTLTLPGIAGIILTIGMSVDANVLIFERIKEELKNGRSMGSAINSGFNKAFVTILDANLTTVIAALFLLQFGSGPVKGFAVTLITGICASMFTALFVSKAIFQVFFPQARQEKKEPGKSLFCSSRVFRLFHKEQEIPFMKKTVRRITALISLCVIVAGCYLFFDRGFNQGIDFSGGVMLEMSFKEETGTQALRTSLKEAGLNRAVIQQIGKTGDRFLVKTKDVNVSAADLEKAAAGVGEFTMLSKESVGPQVGDGLKQKTVLAATWALIGMLIYIAVRFKWVYGIAAVLTLGHDLLVCLTVLLLFDIELSLSVAAALMFVIGYSLNDTIVIFDRTRETLKQGKAAGKENRLERVLNRSITQTLSRTIVTSGTTLAAVLSLLVLGGDVLYTFSFTLLVGILVGTYSSIFQSCSWLYLFSRRSAERHRA
jgi:protein-export membrane protein SecD/preprotein translocase SecF subunit